VIAGEDGNIYAYPNNKILWHDASYNVQSAGGCEGLEAQHARWSAEG
jgi:hypothetical protein